MSGASGGKRKSLWGRRDRYGLAVVGRRVRQRGFDRVPPPWGEVEEKPLVAVQLYYTDFLKEKITYIEWTINSTSFYFGGVFRLLYYVHKISLKRPNTFRNTRTLLLCLHRLLTEHHNKDI